jgi:hypothetical protein
VRRLTTDEAWQWRLHGPADAEVAPEHRWWEPADRSIPYPAV